MALLELELFKRETCASVSLDFFFFFFFTSRTLYIHTDMRTALQYQITESGERGYIKKNEIWRKEGEELNELKKN